MGRVENTKKTPMIKGRAKGGFQLITWYNYIQFERESERRNL
jgi:hypothetical protein